MANEIEPRRPYEAYIHTPQHDERADAIMRSCLSGSHKEHGQLVVFQLPEGDQRVVLAKRQQELVESLKHEKKKIAGLVAEMLEGYRHRGVKPTENAVKVIEVYVRELGLDPKIPTWAVWRACGAIRTGNDLARLEAAGVRLYEAPTTMSLRRLCDSYAWDVRAELGKIGEVLQARLARPVTPPAERERVAKEFRALADDMKERLAGDASAGAPPLTEEQLIELAGGEEAFAALPDAKGYGVPKTVAALVKGATGV